MPKFHGMSHEDPAVSFHAKHRITADFGKPSRNSSCSEVGLRLSSGNQRNTVVRDGASSPNVEPTWSAAADLIHVESHRKSSSENAHNLIRFFCPRWLFQVSVSNRSSTASSLSIKMSNFTMTIFYIVKKIM